MLKPLRQEVLDSIDKGIRKAQDDYTKGSRSLLCWGPEYLITVNIFQSLLDLPAIEDSLSLEEKASDVEKYRRDRRGRKPACVSGRSRCDLVLWHANKDGPRAVIEVKRWAKQCSSDIKRLTRLVSQVQGLEFSIAASCLFERVNNNSDNAEDKLQRDIKKLHRSIEESVKGSNLGVRLEPKLLRIERVTIPVDEKTESEEDWVWCPVCFMIYHKKSRR